jgi:hypothetical protein
MPLLQQYKPALKPIIPLVPKQVVEDGYLVVNDDKTLVEWKAGQYIESWTERMRKWLVRFGLLMLVIFCNPWFNGLIKLMAS